MVQEIPLAGVHMQSILAYKDLPIKMVAYGRCFRAEAGAYGQATRGMYRVHQFSKVEMFGITEGDPALSDALLEEFRGIQEALFSSLGIHARVLDMPTEDLGAPAYKKYDIEAWLPGRQAFGEISSASNCTDYQARRLGIKHWQRPQARGGEQVEEEAKGHKGRPESSGTKPLFAHTVNGTACAVPRMIIALLETHQQEDGSVDIPEALQPYMGGRTRILPKYTNI
eukprot:Colp12_sorted_trinity150504_noHs@34060